LVPPETCEQTSLNGPVATGRPLRAMFPCEMARYIARFAPEARKYGWLHRPDGPKSCRNGPVWRPEAHRGCARPKYRKTTPCKGAGRRPALDKPLDPSGKSRLHFQYSEIMQPLAGSAFRTRSRTLVGPCGRLVSFHDRLACLDLLADAVTHDSNFVF